MIDPNTVLSPMNKISDLKVVIQEKDYSIATFVYGETKKTGIRWNETEQGNMGYPTSHGSPTWFVIPKEVALAYASWRKKDVSIQAFLQATQGFN